jgi:hypothetical protein
MAMETIKSYTDIERSKVLAEILPLDSADYFYKYCIGHYNSIHYRLETYPYNKGANKNHDIPCWSLSALLDVLPDKVVIDGHCWGLSLGKKRISYLGHMTFDGQLHISVEGDNLLDACVKMILHLKEKSLI